MKKRILLLMLIIIFSLLAGIYLIYQEYLTPSSRTRKVFDFLRNPNLHQEWVSPALLRCGDAPFVIPTTGMIGFLWDDSFRPGHHHQGIDIFSGKGVGETPVYAVYDGYLTRLPDWKSSVIIRIPSDPLQADRQIWAYYTHMADPAGESLIAEDFPPGTKEMFVTAGTLLGYQGNYSGKPDTPTGIHLHFSIVKDNGKGLFLNELEIRNTLDPSPYFGLSLNGKKGRDHIPVCVDP